MRIGHIIYKIRNEAKQTQAEFAENLGVSQQSVQKWESGASVPELGKIILISKYFDVSLDALYWALIIALSKKWAKVVR